MTDQPFPPTECWVWVDHKGRLVAAEVVDGVTFEPQPGMTRAYLVPPERVEWQDISTAPRDWTPVWAWHEFPDVPDGEIEEDCCKAQFDTDEGQWIEIPSGRPIRPTHWMPLPEPPR